MDEVRAGIDATFANWRATRSDERLQRQFSDPDFDDSAWAPIAVPAHWQTQPGFEDFDGTLLYRCDLTVPSLQPRQRRWLRFHGICYSSDVFLDGAYLGQTEGYFSHHRFEITELAHRAGTSILAIEVGAPSAPPEGERRSALTGWFTEAPGTPIGWNPAGIWQPIEVIDTGPVAIRHFRVICTDADRRRARLMLRAVLLVDEPGQVDLVTEIAGVVDRDTHDVAAGENRVEWQVEIANPELWWPHDRGDQPLFDCRVQARTADDTISDRKYRRIGFRAASMRDFILRVNDQRIFMKGINVAPTELDLAATASSTIRAELENIRDAGFNLVRVRSHVTRREFYDHCDELGLLVWQDMPMIGSYSRGVTEQVEQQVRDLVDLVGHRPSVVVWGGHMRPHTDEPRSTAVPAIRHQQLPSWNRSVLDRALRRTFRQSDPSREVVAHSEVAPHVPHLAGSDVGMYFGWFEGQATQLADYAAMLPRMVRFVSDMGGQALPASVDRDLDAMLHVAGAETDALHALIPPSSHPDVASWLDEMRRVQATLLTTTIETLRVLKYRPTGGFCAGLWRAVGPGLSRALVDHDGTPRPAHAAAVRAMQPVLPVLYPPGSTILARTSNALALHVVNDLDRAVDLEVRATIADHRGERARRWHGKIDADSVAFLDDITLRGGRIGDETRVDLRAVGEGVDASNSAILRAV